MTQDMTHARGRACFACMPVCRKGAALASAFDRAARWRRAIAGDARQVVGLCRRLRCGLLPHAFGQWHGFVGALQELDGHEDHLLVAEILEIVDLELAGAVGLVPRLAGRVGIFDGGAVVHVLASAVARHRGPEIVEHVAVKADPLAGLEADCPHPDPIALRYQRVPDARIRVVLLPLEFRGDLRRPRRFHRTVRLLVQHRLGHGIPPSLARYIATFARQEMAGSNEKASKRRALIVGGSMSGLLAALLLRRAGWDVDVFERVESELAGRGAGIVAQPDLIETLRRLGIDPTARWAGTTSRKILDASGRLVGEFDCPQV